jgi:hypothetical protein
VPSINRVKEHHLQVAAERSTAEGDKPGSGVRWIRSYVLAEESGEVGTFCVYEADSPEAIRAHAQAADLPVLGKLDARSRVEASHRAGELGLLG